MKAGHARRICPRSTAEAEHGLPGTPHHRVAPLANSAAQTADAPHPLPTSPLQSIGALSFALADDHDPAHRDGVDQLAHRVDGGSVTALLIAAAHPTGRPCQRQPR